MRNSHGPIPTRPCMIPRQAFSNYTCNFMVDCNHLILILEEQDHFENGPETGYPTVCLYFTHLLTFLSIEMYYTVFKTCMYIWISEIKQTNKLEKDTNRNKMVGVCTLFEFSQSGKII